MQVATSGPPALEGRVAQLGGEEGAVRGEDRNGSRPTGWAQICSHAPVSVSGHRAQGLAEPSLPTVSGGGP